jgi:cystathionine beta-lyase/cystathionine gamma-synthase
MTPQARAAAGIKDNLLRLSVGLEDEADLIGDLANAIESARG